MRPFIAGALCAIFTITAAYPGMEKTLAEIRARVDVAGTGAAPDGGPDDEFDSTELIGDLIYPNLTEVGLSIKNIITGNGDPQSSETYAPGTLPNKDTAACRADTCCIWSYIAKDMHAAFRGNTGRCNNLARGAVRIGFHDAAGWSKFTGPLGGADGSIILAPEEMKRIENHGLEPIVAQMTKWHTAYEKYGVSMADLIQMGATVATVTCPLGPRIRTYVGREDSYVPCTNGLLPPVNGSADFLIEMFSNKTIAPHGLTALIGAHTTSQQQFVDPKRAGDPQDGTPGVWDVLFYQQTLGTVKTPKRVFKFQSDIVLSQDPRIEQEFQEFAGTGGQDHWNEVRNPFPNGAPFHMASGCPSMEY